MTSFLRHIFEYPLKWRTYSAVWLLQLCQQRLTSIFSPLMDCCLEILVCGVCLRSVLSALTGIKLLFLRAGTKLFSLSLCILGPFLQESPFLHSGTKLLSLCILGPNFLLSLHSGTRLLSLSLCWDQTSFSLCILGPSFSLSAFWDQASLSLCANTKLPSLSAFWDQASLSLCAETKLPSLSVFWDQASLSLCWDQTSFSLCILGPGALTMNRA